MKDIQFLIFLKINVLCYILVENKKCYILVNYHEISFFIYFYFHIYLFYFFKESLIFPSLIDLKM